MSLFLIIKIITMFNYIAYFFIIFLTVIFMEIVAILTHKYIMHGPGWYLHKSHHTNYDSVFQLNDLYFFFFSLPSMFCIIFGILYNNNILISIGIGMLFYGLIYIFIHDLIVHNRFNFKISYNNTYLKKIKKSHLKHHANKNKNGATDFGFISYK